MNVVKSANPYTRVVLDKINAGLHRHNWSEVEHGRLKFLVSNVMQVDEGGEWVRVFGASNEMADIVAAELGVLLPTQKLLEIVESHPETTRARGPFTQKNGAKGMTRDAALRHAMQHKVNGTPTSKLVAGEGKAYVVHNQTWSDPSRAMIYGIGPWELQPLYMGHFYSQFWDYSQGLGPFVHPNCWVDGKMMDIRDVMMSSKLAGLVSFDGKMRGWHHPQATEVYRQSPSATLPVLTKQRAKTYTTREFIQARHYNPMTNRDIKWIVMHTAEIVESAESAERLAAWASVGQNMQVSWHYCLDNDSVVQCLKDQDRAWCAGRVGNDHGLHIEMAGYARQDSKGWDDDFSRNMLGLAASLVAEKCKEHSLPVEFVNAEGLRRGDRGITDHNEIRKAFPGTTTHHDVGPHFPWQEFLNDVQG